LPFDAICVTAWSTIAAGRGMITMSTPIRIMPPAMPKMPEINEVATTVRPSDRMNSGVMAGFPPPQGCAA
jgi:hypothetical protein